ncbi:hypothetical protein AKJ44_01115 [candidate division MSBL1 archaeon SCGC-AAA261F17]|uniref:Uncharacterized protein n=1 Tax=candidate division MSBL1 archaeon SCGC-AAA261F17 TaxID=1698274 RepID=A0A133V6Y2_9EURY|nr:hypothetical protein AKJ44_01115 [candidate division MSBL1 archaeon SCGC-AAA261F17]
MENVEPSMEDEHFASTSVPVSQGDSLKGLLDWSIRYGWVIKFSNESTGEFSSLRTSAIGHKNVETVVDLEVHNAEETNDLYGDTNFTDMKFWDYGGEPVDIQWEGYVNPDTPFSGLDVMVYGDSHVELKTGRD